MKGSPKSYKKAEKMEPKAMKMAEKKAGKGSYSRGEGMESKKDKMLELGIIIAPSGMKKGAKKMPPKKR